MLELIEKLDYWNLILASIIVSVLASALHTYFPEFYNTNTKKKWNVVIVTFAVTFLNISIFMVEQKLLWQEYILKFLFTWAFALLFYSILGTWVINKIFTSIKTKYDNQP